MTRSHTSALTRRRFIGNTLTAAGAALLAPPTLSRIGAAAEATRAIDIGSRRELFVDDFLVERLSGTATLQLHHPEPKDIALLHDEPWEGSGSGYHSVFQDGDLYRMYYKSWQLTVTPDKLNTGEHPLYCCYAESDDGIHWRKPSLGLYDFRGSKENNIVMAGGKGGLVNVDPGHPAVFKDDNPAAPPSARYKAIARSSGPHGLLALQSPDGIHWSLMSDAPVITDGAFDSQNLAFWDAARGEYRAYWRYFTGGTTDKQNWKPAGVRAIRTATSRDFLRWSKPADVTYTDSPVEELYTNQVKPYHRAPHVLIGFPTRYLDRDWSPSMKALPELEHRQWRARANGRYGTALTEGLFMAGRDGVTFKRWNEAFLRPGIERPGTWNYGQQYIGWHIVETRSALQGAPNELSLYATESYWTGQSSALRRYTLRMDGFVSVNASMKGGEIATKPVQFQGEVLQLNFSSSAAGDIRVEIQDAQGKAIPGFALDDCLPLFGDSPSRRVEWKSGTDVSKMAGQAVRLRFVLRDADLFAFQFSKESGGVSNTTTK